MTSEAWRRPCIAELSSVSHVAMIAPLRANTTTLAFGSGYGLRHFLSTLLGKKEV
jgi:hypothetical protein